MILQHSSGEARTRQDGAPGAASAVTAVRRGRRLRLLRRGPAAELAAHAAEWRRARGDAGHVAGAVVCLRGEWRGA